MSPESQSCHRYVFKLTNLSETSQIRSSHACTAHFTSTRQVPVMNNKQLCLLPGDVVYLSTISTTKHAPGSTVRRLSPDYGGAGKCLAMFTGIWEFTITSHRLTECFVCAGSTRKVAREAEPIHGISLCMDCHSSFHVGTGVADGR